MPGAQSFVKVPQRPSPDPRQVGQALLQQGQQGGRPQAPAGMLATPPGMPTAGVGDSTEDAFRRAGAVHMGGPGQRGTGSGLTDILGPDAEPPETPDHESAATAAMGEALTRMGSGVMPNRSAFVDRDRRRRDLLRLGATPFEIELLVSTGGGL